MQITPVVTHIAGVYGLSISVRTIAPGVFNVWRVDSEGSEIINETNLYFSTQAEAIEVFTATVLKEDLEIYQPPVITA